VTQEGPKKLWGVLGSLLMVVLLVVGVIEIKGVTFKLDALDWPKTLLFVAGLAVVGLGVLAWVVWYVIGAVHRNKCDQAEVGPIKCSKTPSDTDAIFKALEAFRSEYIDWRKRDDMRSDQMAEQAQRLARLEDRFLVKEPGKPRNDNRPRSLTERAQRLWKAIRGETNSDDDERETRFPSLLLVAAAA
jgi:hypothetical protein